MFKDFILPIEFKDIVFDLAVYSYCKNPKFTCPHYGHSWACPPASPFLKASLLRFERFFLVGVQFDIDEYVKDIQKKHPKRKRAFIIKQFYRKGNMDKKLNERISAFLDEKKGKYDDFFAIWAGNCDICMKEGKKCTYDEGIPCRYPEKIKYGMSAVGINTVETVKNLKIELNWTNQKYNYRFGLVCLR